MSEVVIIATAVDSRSRAEALAEALVAARVAACVQVSPVESWYRWKGEVERAEEFLLQAKTTAARAPAAQALIAELHTYELPEITVAPVMDGSPAYLAWVARSVGTSVEEQG
jgi:periplasmic divalent cation tolerance protein